MELKVQLLSPDLEYPSYGSEDAAGLDLRSDVTTMIKPGHWESIPTGIKVAIPKGHAGFIWPRSGFANKFAIDTLAGLIDCDYRGEIRVILINHGAQAVFIERGERIAQMVIQQYVKAQVVPCDALPNTERGSNGFGSTGTK